MSLKKTIVVFCFLWIAAACACHAYENVNPRGPMAIRNQMPLYLFWYAFGQERAGVVAEKKLDTTFDYTVSNVIVNKSTWAGEEYIVKADMEVNRYNLGLRYGILENAEVSLDVPYLVLSKGYLDTFISNFERGVGATAVGARRKTDKYQFNYSLQHNYQDLVSLREPVDGIGDVAVNAKYMIRDETGALPRISARAAVKIPTGSTDKYLGSGKCDYGFGLLLDKRFGRFFAYANGSAVYIPRPSFLSDLRTKKYILSGMLAGEYCFTERFSSVVQGTFHSTPYPKTGTEPLDNAAGELALGLNYQFTERSSYHIAVVENCFADSTPDVTFQIGGRIGW